jgi:hypothetical protein
MTSPQLNPFRYGNPVSPSKFIGRERTIRTLFARIYNGDSTAIVGEPHIGKTSLLHYILDEGVRKTWLGDTAQQFAFIDIDCHMLPASYQPARFWSMVLDRVEEAFADATIKKQIEVVRQSDYGSFSIKRLFDLLGQREMRAVVLVDEFDVLLHHINFNSAEFFGALRSLAIQTDGLALLSASRMTVGEMNRRCQEINPFGSPFFNNLIEVRLQPLRPKEVDMLIDQTLASSRITFSKEDRTYIVRATGRHPFLVQLAAAALFDVLASPEQIADRYVELESKIQKWAGVHFEDIWHNLSAELKQVALILALTELGQQSILQSTFNDLTQYDTELHWLADGGLIESTQEGQCVAWQGKRWRIGANCFTHWLANTRKWKEILGPELNPEESARRIRFLQEKVITARRRLEQRELQRSQFGISADPAIITEIEDLRRAINNDEREMRRLGGHV